MLRIKARIQALDNLSAEDKKEERRSVLGCHTRVCTVASSQLRLQLLPSALQCIHTLL
jgi:hypothetical protein